MTIFDADIAIAEMKAAEIMIQHHLRHIQRNGDVAAAKEFVAILSRACDYARKVVKEIAKPDRWMLYCSGCGFEGAEMEQRRPQCPVCGEGLRLWDLSLGWRPKRRI